MSDERVAAALRLAQERFPDLIAIELPIPTELKARPHDAEAELASATDLLNTWAREMGVLEAHDEYEIKGVIDRLWASISSRLHTAEEQLWEISCNQYRLREEENG